jgi:hypothetical protein
MKQECCLGICCERHSTCLLYRRVEGSVDTSRTLIGTCGHDRPKYIPVQPAKEKV